MNLRAWLYRVLMGAGRDGWARYVNAGLMMLILANVVAVIVGSVEAVDARWGPWLDAFELVSVVIFSVEYIARMWVCVESPDYQGWRGRVRYAFTPMALIDLLAIAPFYLSLWFEADARFLRAIRLFRVFKLTRHSASMDLLLTVLRKEIGTVLSAMFIMMIIIVLAASGIHMIERDAQPETFGNIPQAMWWAAVTLTTVGYGDVVPITVAGKLFGLLITVAGVGMVALPAGILASGFSLELQKRREAFRLQVQQALEGGITATQAEELELVRTQLGVRADEAAFITDTERAAVCPHCGKAI